MVTAEMIFYPVSNSKKNVALGTRSALMKQATVLAVTAVIVF